MEALDGTLQLENFYPKEYLQVTGMHQEADKIIIRMKANVSNCICPKCSHMTTKYHGTYVRKVQDLPILGKTVMLEITAHEYNCTNNECTTSTITDDFNGFLNSYSRMTERCADFICTLALETSCEGCARICQKLGIHISGDTVIRLLLKRYEALPDPVVSNVIGVDDFAYKKRHTYGTIIVDEKTHKPITLLDGRDGSSLHNWLKHNKQVKVVTRDRASAYAKVISEVLPDAIQVADRFHLHQNLLEAVKKALNHELPATIAIQHEKSDKNVSIPGKKNRI